MLDSIIKTLRQCKHTADTILMPNCISVYCMPATQSNRKIFNKHLNSTEWKQNGNFKTSMSFVLRFRI